MRDVLVPLVIAALVMTGTARAAEEKLVAAWLLADVDAIAPGKSFTLGLLLKMKEHWHTYWINPGESGEPTRIDIKAPAGLEFGPIQWPIPRKINTNGAVTYGYEDQVMLLIPVTVSNAAALAGPIRIDARAGWLSCSGEECVEGGADLSVVLPVGEQSRPANAALFDSWRDQLPLKSDNRISKWEQGDQTLSVIWKMPPASVDWYPVSTSAVMIDPPRIAASHNGQSHQIHYKTTIFKPEELGDGQLRSLLVYTDEKGKKRGIWLPIRIDSVKSR